VQHSHWLEINADTYEIQEVEVTDQREADGTQFEELLSQLPPETVLSSICNVGAYDGRRVYRATKPGTPKCCPPYAWMRCLGQLY